MEQEISDLTKQALEGLSNFESLETFVRDTSLRVGAGILEPMMNSDRGDCQATLTHPDGTVMNYAGRREKTFVTVLGEITLKRAYYTDGNDREYFPQDEKLGLDRDSLSDGVKRMIDHTASVLSFKESSLMIENLATLHVNSKQVECAAEDLGEEISRKERFEIEMEHPAAKPFGMRDQLPTMRLLKVPLPVIWMRIFPISLVGWREKPEEGDSIKLNGRSSSATELYGSGT